MAYTISEMIRLTGLTRRTLHYYDEIGLLVPQRDSENNYRSYSDLDVFKLQQIMFYRELDFELMDIKSLLNAPESSLIESLKSQRRHLNQRKAHFNQLIDTLDKTLFQLERETVMTQNMFKGFTEEKQTEYTKEAAEKWGPVLVANSQEKWRNYSKQKQTEIKEEMHANYQRIAALMPVSIDSQSVQAEIAIWHENLKYFYEPTLNILRGLGELYVQDERFTKNIDKAGVGLSAYMNQAIAYYCDHYNIR